MRLGMGELILILAIALLLFGSKKLPELASGMGKAIKNFRRGLEGDEEVDVSPAAKQVSEESSAKPVNKAVTEAEVVEANKAAKS
jgi:sec-independent protein translocase protein TatA